MFLIVAAWIYCFLLSLCIGAGFLNLINRWVGPAVTIRFGGFYQFWFGFIVLVGLLQVISLFLPVGMIAFIFLSVLAAGIAVFHFKKGWGKVQWLCAQLFTVKGVLSLLAVLLLLLLTAYSANREVGHADTYIYHFNGVKWAREYPAVPGLANLHGRLGFNSSFFLFAAFTEIGVYVGQSAHVAGSFLVVVCMIHWFFIIVDPREQMAKRIFCAMTFLFLVGRVASWVDITSLSTDNPMAVMTLLFCLLLLDKLEHKILLLLPVAAVIFAFKLSGMLAIGVGLVVLAGYIFLLKYGPANGAPRKARVRVLWLSFGLFSFIVLGFVIRNAIVSGWLIYPFPVGNLHLPWSVPTPYVVDMLEWVKSWPKLPGGASPATIAGGKFMYWVYPWFAEFRHTYEFAIFCGTVLLLPWAVFQIPAFGRFVYARLNLVLLILFAVGNIFFWFTSAPDVRFGSVFFFIFLASSVVLLWETSPYKIVLQPLIFLVCLYQVSEKVATGYPVNGPPQYFTFAYTKPLKLIRQQASPPGEKPALFIYMPAEGDACGDSPLPCTPYAGGYLHHNLTIRQREPGNLAKGFYPGQ